MSGMVSYTSMYGENSENSNILVPSLSDLENSDIKFDEDEEDNFEVEVQPNDARGEAFNRWRRKRYLYLKSRGVEAMPCVLIFDSLPATKRQSNLKVVRDFLKLEWDFRRSERDGDLHFNKDTIRGFCPRVPGQNNLIDCGVFMLHYVECFFKNPVTSYTKQAFQYQFSQWFTQDQIDCNRDYIRRLIVALREKNAAANNNAASNT